MKKKKFPLVGYISTWPDLRVVKVKIITGTSDEDYPYIVCSLEPGVKIWNEFERYSVADTSLVKLYPTRRKAIKDVLDILFNEYLQAKRDLRIAEKRVKLRNKRIFEYKNFEQVYSMNVKT